MNCAYSIRNSDKSTGAEQTGGTADRYSYNDAVDAGSPGSREDAGEVGRVALLAVVDALKHAIFSAA